MPLNTTDGYVELDSFPSKVFLTPSISYQLDKNGKMISSKDNSSRDTFSFNKVDSNFRSPAEPNKYPDNTVGPIYKTYQ